MPVKVEVTPPLPGLSPVGGKPLVARFVVASLTGDPRHIYEEIFCGRG